jgi:hypothetical protein
MSDARLGMIEQELTGMRATLRDLLSREVGLSVLGSGSLGATGVAGTAVTWLAAGAILYVTTLLYAVRAVTGGDENGGVVTLAPGDSFALYNDGTDVLTLSVTAGGALQVQRTAGADSFDVKVMGIWL